MEIIGVVASVLGVGTGIVLWILDRRRKSALDVNIPIALMGLRSTGKTRLVWTWSKAQLIKDEKPGPTRARNVFRLDRAPAEASGRLVRPAYQFHDYAGEQPGLFLDDVVGKYVYAAVIVLDHTAEETAGPIDGDRIQRQVGYIDGLVRGYLQSSRLSSELEVVVLFVNKADLYSEDQAALVKAKYMEAYQILKGTGKRCEMFVGSAQEGWKTMDALAMLDERLLRPQFIEQVARRQK